jgi:hypothetical protein
VPTWSATLAHHIIVHSASMAKYLFFTLVRKQPPHCETRVYQKPYATEVSPPVPGRRETRPAWQPEGPSAPLVLYHSTGVGWPCGPCSVEITIVVVASLVDSTCCRIDKLHRAATHLCHHSSSSWSSSPTDRSPAPP